MYVNFNELKSQLNKTQILVQNLEPITNMENNYNYHHVHEIKITVLHVIIVYPLTLNSLKHQDFGFLVYDAQKTNCLCCQMSKLNQRIPFDT